MESYNQKRPSSGREGCVKAHSDHRFYRTELEREQQSSSFRYDLNGLWRFHYAKNPAQVIPGFEKDEYTCKNWDYIRVPAHIQLEGYDVPQYANTQYPWEGHEALIPGQVPQDFNPVASYVKYFEVPKAMAGERIFLALEGAESAATVWLNGAYIGYHEDSFTPGEFELTDHIRAGENKLAVQVTKWCLGSWCEDQDFFRFSGLYRDVYLYSIPKTHLWDLKIQAIPSEDLQTAAFRLDGETDGRGRIHVELKDGKTTVFQADQPLEGGFHLDTQIDCPRLWSSEDPYLYDCLLTVFDDRGQAQEYIQEAVGFRRFELRDSLMCLNGKRIQFCGVNRHEFTSLRGRSVTEADVERDLRIMKQNNINAIRTSHYPNTSWLYRLCDRYGLYLIDETNLETHGTWDMMESPEDLARVVPGDDPQWREMLLERVNSVYERDKNHPSVLIWSCGNESFGGSVIYDMSQRFRQKDPTRLVHYEGIFNDRRYPDTSDVESQMYTPAAEIEAFLKVHRDKPFICCEYAHAMGNSCGALHKYTELSLREPLYQGGFIWDFADQAILKKNRYGEPFYAYGGDFDDYPTDYSFSGNGLVDGGRRISPKMQEVKFLYQPVSLEVEPDRVRICNHSLFTNTQQWECRVRVERFGRQVEKKDLVTAVPPLEERTYPLDLVPQNQPGEYTVTVSFHLREKTLWAEAGHEVAFGQTAYRVQGRKAPQAPGPVVVNSKHNIGVHGEGFAVMFSKLTGGLVSYRYGGRELLDGMPKPNFWRAPTDNDRGNLMGARYGQWKLASLYLSNRQVTRESPVMKALPMHFAEKPNSAVVGFTYWLPTTPEAFCTLDYEVFGDGKVTVTLHYDSVPELGDMPEFGVIFPLKADFDHLHWYGFGPSDTYADRKHGAKLGLYENLVSGNLAPYLVPQECGNKEGVRFAAVTDEKGRGMLFEAQEGQAMSFSALPYTPHQMEEAAHPYELPKVHHTFVRAAMAQMGVGGDDSWGARTHEEYLLPRNTPLDFTFSFRGI